MNHLVVYYSFFINPLKNPQDSLNKAAGWARDLINSNELAMPDEER